MCGSKALAGPATPPAGARVVRSGNIGKAARRSAPGAVIWIGPGVHTLGNGPYDQITPKDRQIFIGAPGAVIDGRHRNLYAFTGNAKGVRISYLTIADFGGPGDNNNQGVVNHDAGHFWRIDHNTVTNSAGAGVFLGTGDRLVSNCLKGNGQYGFSSYEPQGLSNIVLRHNEIAGNNTDDWEQRQPGCGCTGGGKFWDTRDADVVDNWVHGNHGPGLWADTNNAGFLFDGNLISDNDGQGIFYEISYNARIVHNTFRRNGLVEGPTNTGFPTGAIYLSESGSDPAVAGRFSRHFVVAHNRFVDNWAGVMAWENPDRFAGSPANSSSGYTTLVAPQTATLSACSDPPLIGTKPYFNDCRWKVKNLRVRDNTFRIDPERIPGCTQRAGCGFQGLVSNYGTYPSWSPYKKYVVPDNITFTQNNEWLGNRYVGPWHFVIHTLGNSVSWHRWRSPRYGQDPDSTRE